MMKKISASLLSLVMILGLAGCSNSASQLAQPSTEDTSAESTTNIEETETKPAVQVLRVRMLPKASQRKRRFPAHQIATFWLLTSRPRIRQRA